MERKRQCTSLCTSTIESAVYENRTYSAVRGRRLVTASYSIAKQLLLEVGLRTEGTFLIKSTLLAVLSSSCVSLAFTKYRRAQIALVLSIYSIKLYCKTLYPVHPFKEEAIRFRHRYGLRRLPAILPRRPWCGFRRWL